ncbi:MAG: YtxH-like protein [Cyanobacteria bacterium RYN_339]|nr:YtxH-like protein [Cyanobacteria bacterium RYN_339]
MARKPVSYLAGAAVLGTAIGAVAALLASPKHGPELRKTFKKRATEAGQLVGDAGRAIPERLSRLPQQGREALEQLRRRREEAPKGTRVTVEGDHSTVDEESGA